MAAAAEAICRHQPFVDIVTNGSVPLENNLYSSLTLNYSPNHSRILLYTEECWKLFVGSTHNDLCGGPLLFTHSLYEIHGHWGMFQEFCSEHTVDNDSYAGELHLLHTDNGRNGTSHPTNAKSYKDPLFRAVTCIFLKIGKKNEELGKITDVLLELSKDHNRLRRIEVGKDKDRLHNIGGDLDVNPFNLFPDNLEYWTYEEIRGELEFDDWVKVDFDGSSIEDTREKVTYIIFKTPIEISKEQFESMNPLAKYDDGRVYDFSTMSPIREGVARRQN